MTDHDDDDEDEDDVWEAYGRGEEDGRPFPGSARRRALPDDPVPALVRQLRRRLGLSQRALAAAAGVAAGTVRRAENGQDIGVPALRRLLLAGDLDIAAVSRTPTAPAEGVLAQYLESGCTSRLLAALAAEDPTGGLRGRVVQLGRRCRTAGPETARASWAVGGRLAGGVWLPPEVLARTWPATAAGRVRETRVAERPLPVVVPDRSGPHAWYQHELLPVLGPGDLAAAPGTPPAAAGLLHLAEALLALGAAGDRADRRPPPHRLPEPQARVRREREDDLTRWGPADDPCDGPDHRLGGPRAE